MAHASARMTHVQLVALAKTEGRFHDGHGLYLDSRPPRASWAYRFTIGGKARWMGLGPYPEVGLKEARDAAFEARRLVKVGKDPLTARREVREAKVRELAAAITFKACADGYLRSYRDSWANEKHAAQWLSTLQNYVYPIIGEIGVTKIDVPLIIRILNQDVRDAGRLVPLWSAKNETASRIRGRIESILGWAASNGFRPWENPASWRILKHQLPPRSRVARKGHHSALPYAELPAFLIKLKAEYGLAAEALQLAILTAARTTEVLKARWREFDLDSKVWTVPAERMKAKKQHRVPLSDTAIELLQRLDHKAGGEAWVFPGIKEGKPLSNMVMLMLLRRMQIEGVTVHGFRSTFRDWAAEETNHDQHIAEMALAHTISNKVEASYRRGDLFNKRIALMADWSAYCASASATA
jgi:integrase